ncbi:NAD(P)H-dependent flavin oxidoreductase [Peribacillus alkalitolerans]|uniref:NAD(P)H-dependent flavin oxidoreductase n=1 Tax=Peribacillus alkalitolerans TaxID=1550385 RepID=UPI0013D577AA|nr:nitronate monooxygenase [Peribacillus alkalitolerans]
MKIHTKLCELLGIQYPIIQAGMAGGPANADLVIAVSEAGGLGTLGAAYMKPEEIRESIRKIKSNTKKPFAVNLFSTNMEDNLEGIESVQPVLNKMREKFLIAPKGNRVHTDNLFKEQFEILIEENVPIISTAFGLLSPVEMDKLKSLEIKTMAMITTVKEAVLAENNGVDVLVAQGSDAGGHRGTFDVSENPYGANIGTFSLIPQVVDAVNIPVVAAGGIMDGRGLVAALALGAEGVQMGTAFLTSQESGAHPSYKQALHESNEESTVLTRVFSGRPARGIKNTFITDFEKSGISPMSFPTQNSLTGDIRKEAAKQNNQEYMSLWAGQATRLLRKSIEAGNLVEICIREAEQLLEYDK